MFCSDNRALDFSTKFFALAPPDCSALAGTMRHPVQVERNEYSPLSDLEPYICRSVIGKCWAMQELHSSSMCDCFDWKSVIFMTCVLSFASFVLPSMNSKSKHWRSDPASRTGDMVLISAVKSNLWSCFKCSFSQTVPDGHGCIALGLPSPTTASAVVNARSTTSRFGAER